LMLKTLYVAYPHTNSFLQALKLRSDHNQGRVNLTPRPFCAFLKEYANFRIRLRRLWNPI
jgi:hypothetical protein